MTRVTAERYAELGRRHAVAVKHHRPRADILAEMRRIRHAQMRADLPLIERVRLWLKWGRKS